MNSFTNEFIWSFPGNEPGLISAVFLAILFVGLSYLFTLRKLPLLPKVIFSSLRIMMTLLLIFCLANPKYVKKEKSKQKKKTKIGILIDSSGSMSKKGFWDKIRFNQAVKYYQTELKQHQDKFDFSLYTFNEKISKVKKFNLLPTNNLLKTFLFDSLIDSANSLSIQNYDGMIVMSDFIDTSGKGPAALSQFENADNLEIAFIPIKTSIYSPPVVSFEKIECASAAQIGTEIPVTILFKISTFAKHQKFKLIVKKNDKQIFDKEFWAKDENSFLKTVNLSLPLKKTGLHFYSVEIISDDKSLASAFWSVNVLDKQKLRVLLYQGRLDWGTRYLKHIFDKDKNSMIDIRFAPKSFGKGFKNKTYKFPPVEDFNIYDVVILFNLKRKQITSKLENKLTDYVNDGGSLLFITGNSYAAQEFVESPIEKMLPVKFASMYEKYKLDKQTRAFLEKMKKYRITKNINNFRQLRKKDLFVPPLNKFKLTEFGKKSPMFNFVKSYSIFSKMIVPQFIDCAIVDKIKPGATVLAVHPYLKKGTKNRVLLAIQKYAKGRTAVLATDLLWQWRLSLKSKNYSYDNFWKSFINWLSVAHVREPQWILSSSIYNHKREDEIKFYLPPSYKYNFDEIEFTAVQNVNEREKLILTSGNQKNIYKTDFIPESGNVYVLFAKKDDEIITSSVISCPENLLPEELKILKPDISNLKNIAAAFNGKIIETDKHFDWNKWLPPPGEIITKTETKYLWHRWWIFLIILFLYLTELIIRRFWKLV